jgi:hypothetical protein
MTTLMDSVRIDVPTRSPVQPAAPLDPPRGTACESRLSESSLEVESRGGPARTVVGRVAYLDDEAQTHMVLPAPECSSGFPLRDFTRSHVVAAEKAA